VVSANTGAKENDYLDLCHSYLLARLDQGEPQERRQARRLLQSIVTHDETVVAVLRVLADAGATRCYAPSRAVRWRCRRRGL
jgi:hypothetical protein